MMFHDREMSKNDNLVCGCGGGGGSLKFSALSDRFPISSLYYGYVVTAVCLKLFVLSQVEAERLRTTREATEEEIQRLKLAELELIQVF